MIPVFSFIAWSGTGKTTYLERLVTALTARGIRTAVIKHDAHRLALDKPGKDSYRFAAAGARVVALSDSESCAVLEYRPVSFDALLEKITDVDLILVEGWHENARNPIVVHRAAAGQSPKLNPADCIAAVSDVPLETGGKPLFPLDDPAPMVSFLLGFLPAH